MFAFQHRDHFAALVFQVCGQRTTEEIAAELARQLDLGLEKASPDRQIEGIQATLLAKRSPAYQDLRQHALYLAAEAGAPVAIQFLDAAEKAFVAHHPVVQRGSAPAPGVRGREKEKFSPFEIDYSRERHYHL